MADEEPVLKIRAPTEDEKILKQSLDDMELELLLARGALARIVKLEEGEFGELDDPACQMVRIAREALDIDN